MARCRGRRIGGGHDHDRRRGLRRRASFDHGTRPDESGPTSVWSIHEWWDIHILAASRQNEQGFRGEVDADRPREDAADGVDVELCELARFVERSEGGAGQQRGQVDAPRLAVVEPDPDVGATLVSCFSNPEDVGGRS